MKSSDKGNMIIDEANVIVENYIRRKAGYTLKKSEKKINKYWVLSILTISIAVILICIIKII